MATWVIVLSKVGASSIIFHSSGLLRIASDVLMLCNFLKHGYTRCYPVLNGPFEQSLIL